MSEAPPAPPHASTVRIGPVPILAVDAGTARDLIVDAVKRRSPAIFAFCNMHTFNLARRDAAFADALQTMIVFNDGVGMDIASALLFGRKFPANLNGTDLTPEVLSASPAGTRVFLLGSAPGVAEQAGAAFQARYPHLKIVGSHHGFFRQQDGAEIADLVRASSAQLLLVGMGNPAQELWAARHAATASAVTMCIGAFLDFSAAKFSRAPAIVRRLRMEWAYRMILEPRRMVGRYLGGAGPFLLAIMRERLTRPARG